MQHVDRLRFHAQEAIQGIGDERMDDLATAHIWVGDVLKCGPILGPLAVTTTAPPWRKFCGTGAGRQQRRQPRCEGLWPYCLIIALGPRLGRGYRAGYHILIHGSTSYKCIPKASREHICQRPVSGLSAVIARVSVLVLVDYNIHQTILNVNIKLVIIFI